MVEKSVLLEKVCGKIYIREVDKSEFVERFPELSLFYRLFSQLDSEMICIFPYFCPCEEICKGNKGNFYAKVCKRSCQWQVLCI